jgi:serine protease Do
MKTNYFFVLLFILFIIGCTNSSEIDKKDKENELLRQEIKQKDIELDLQTHETYLQRQNDSLKSILPKSERSLSDKYDAVKKSIYLIYTSNETTLSQGSAFVINADGDAISNYHVFANASNMIAINSEGKRFVIDKIYAYDKDKDYIIFRIGPNFNDFNYVKIATNLPRIGEECFAIGNPEGLIQTLSTGIVSSYRNGNHLIQTTAQITHGSSGGALFNKNGEVIGITSSGIEGGGDLNFAININDLPLNNYTNSVTTPNVISQEDITNDEQNEIKKTIDGYYSSQLNSDYGDMKNYLNDYLDRFYTYYNISKEQVIQSVYDYNISKGITPKTCNVDWNSVLITKKTDGYTASFNMLYVIMRREANKPTQFNLKLFFELTSNFKIKSAYENILDRH